MKSKEKVVRPKISNMALVRAWFIKYPWLRDEFNPDEIKKVTVHEFSLDVLSVSSDLTGNKSFDSREMKIVFFNREGSPLEYVGRTTSKRVNFLYWLFGKSDAITSYFRENVDQALQRMGERAQWVAIIVGLKDKNLFITHVPEGQTINSVLEKEMRTALDTVDMVIAEEILGGEEN